MAFKFKTTDEIQAANKKQQADESALRNHQTYIPGTYQQPNDLTDMKGTISNWQTPTWDKTQNTWWNKVSDTMNAIENREKFSYDVNGDALYQQYKDQYVNLGKMASADVMGQAAAMTGGYGNSYAQTVGQQAYQGYLQQLTDKVPELYQLALSKYNSEGEEMYNRLNAYGNLYSTEYGEHRDAVADSNNQLSHLTNLYNIFSNEDYGRWHDSEQMKATANEQEYQKLADLLGVSTETAQNLYDMAYKMQSDEYSTKYTEDRDAITDAQWQKTYDLQKDELKEKQRQFDVENTVDDDDDDIVDDDKPVDFSTFDAGDWNAYFAQIRQSEGQHAAEVELKVLTNGGTIPKKYVASAASGARGGRMGH